MQVTATEGLLATTLLPRQAQSQPDRLRGIRPGVTLAVTAWFLLVVSLGAAGAPPTVRTNRAALLTEISWCANRRALDWQGMAYH
jgi:hypothetical protein